MYFKYNIDIMLIIFTKAVLDRSVDSMRLRFVFYDRQLNEREMLIKN